MVEISRIYKLSQYLTDVLPDICSPGLLSRFPGPGLAAVASRNKILAMLGPRPDNTQTVSRPGAAPVLRSQLELQSGPLIGHICKNKDDFISNLIPKWLSVSDGGFQKRMPR